MKIIVCVLLVLWASCAEAQSLPPACAQYFSAAEACMRNFIDLLERTNPQSAEGMKQKLATVESAKQELQRQVGRDGSLAVAQRCTDPKFVKGMSNALAGLMTPLMFQNAMNEECSDSYNRIQAPMQ